MVESRQSEPSPPANAEPNVATQSRAEATASDASPSLRTGLNVLNLHRGQDTGGQGWRITDAFRRLEPDWTYRSIVRPSSFTYIAYPSDLPYDSSTIREAWAAADVLHLRNDFREARQFEQRLGKRPIVIQYHGTLYRNAPIPRLTEQRRRKALGVVSTLDLWLISPEETEWLPSPYNLEWLRKMRYDASAPRAGDEDSLGRNPGVSHKLV